MVESIRTVREPNVFVENGTRFVKCIADDANETPSTFRFRIRTIHTPPIVITTFSITRREPDGNYGKFKFSLFNEDQITASCESENLYYLENE